MGLLSFLSKKQDKVEDRFKDQIRTKLDNVMKAAQRGASKEEIEELLELAQRPENFHECRGGLAMSAEHILPIMVEKLAGNEVDKKASEFFWGDFVKHQHYCDDFFFGCEMRTYVIARAWKQKFKSMTWDQVDLCLKSGGIDIDTYRKEDWGRVACFEYLADQGHEEREDFQAAWRSMSVEDRRAVVYALSDNEVAFFKLMD